MFLAQLLSEVTVFMFLSYHIVVPLIEYSIRSGLTSPFFETKQIVDLKQQTKLSQQAVCPMF